MPWTQIVFGSCLVAVLLSLAGYYAWRQLRQLRQTAGSGEAGSEEGIYLRRQAWRRLVCSGLMVVLALLLVGALLFLEAPAQALADRGADAAEQPGERAFVNLYSSYWLAFLLVLMALVVLAGVDFWAIRRYGLRQLRRLHADRRAMIARQWALLRQQRGEDD